MEVWQEGSLVLIGELSSSIEPCLARCFNKVAIRSNRPVLTSFLEPQQLALSVAGGAKLVHSVRMMAEANPEFVVGKKNAFNSVK